ncbi:DUF4129 domain-containing protein [Amycolatopsis sp. FDAARGOS 1241]|uniref:DUF4129 domain-containing protein n=1 Tax=Amycolatopsis sp. FDAARGOS 1241 TaxID=2778070 RepID=UPI0019508A10|nr:DUF4129 domain-containing protein [Amycolatopsis sp. FDAARGOS 1241]QRP45016.1 DUF4129 domain-containing protein [Amycolatopsis sp. FDAARGOS 1241]
MTVLFLTDVPVDIDRDPARLRAIEELSNPAYADARPSVLQQLATWLGEKFSELLSSLSGVPGGPLGLLLILALVIVLIVVVRLRVGKVGRAAQAARQLFSGRRRSADEYRKAAEQAAARGQFADAVRERFRALVRGLEERALLDARSGRTADEAAAEAGALLPNLATDLAAGARQFDDVHYGGRPGTEAAYRALTDLDDRVRRERPVLVGA